MAAAFELGDQPAGVGLVVAALEPVRAEVLVGLVALEHVVSADQDRVGESTRCPHPQADPWSTSSSSQRWPDGPNATRLLVLHRRRSGVETFVGIRQGRVEEKRRQIEKRRDRDENPEPQVPKPKSQ